MPLLTIFWLKTCCLYKVTNTNPRTNAWDSIGSKYSMKQLYLQKKSNSGNYFKLVEMVETSLTRVRSGNYRLKDPNGMLKKITDTFLGFGKEMKAYKSSSLSNRDSA